MPLSDEDTIPKTPKSSSRKSKIKPLKSNGDDGGVEMEGEMALKDPTSEPTSSPTKKSKRKSSYAATSSSSTVSEDSPKTPKSTKNKVSIAAYPESPKTPKSTTTKKKSLLKAPMSAPGRTSTKLSSTKDVKSKRSSSIGKYSSKDVRPSWWNLDDPNLLFLQSDSDDDKEKTKGLSPEEIQRRNEQVMQFRDKYEKELRASVKQGTVFKLLEEARQKERESKPVVLPNVRAQPLKIDVSKFEPPVFKQDAEQKTLVKDMAKKNFILKDFVATGAKTDIRKLVKAFEPVQVGKGKTIVNQGEQDDHFYVVEDGTVEFQVDNVTVRTAGAGSTFGDHNLLYQAPSNETVKASDGNPIKLLRLNHSTYRGIMQTTEQAKKVPPPSAAPPPPSSASTPVEDENDWITNSKEMIERKAVQAAIKSHIHSSDDFDHIKVLGEGQFGEVWLVATLLPGIAIPKGKSQHEFALKIQRKLGDDRLIQNIQNEIKTMGDFAHPFISSFYNHYENDESIDMVLGLIPGGDLWEVVHKENEDTGEWLSGIPETHAQFYSMVVADTLSYIHDQGYIFRDLKPENIMVDAKGYPIIVDFGFSKKCTTPTYTFCGTPNYVAPEIVKNLGHNAPVDWWALGIVIYEMISGENPFYYDGLDQMDLYEAICEDKPEPLKEGFSESVVDLINKLLVKDPAKRLGSGKKRGKEILNHRFFTGLNLKRLRLKKIKAPWIPGQDKDSNNNDFEIQLEKDIQAEAEQRALEEAAALRQREEQERQAREAERLKQEELLRLKRLEEEAREKERERQLAEQRAREELEREKQLQEERQRREEELRLQRLEEEERERRLAEEHAREQDEQRARALEEERRRKREEELRLQRILEEEENERLRLEQERQKKKDEEERRFREQQLRLQKEEEEERRRREQEREEEEMQKRVKEEKLRQEKEKRIREEEKARLEKEREEIERLEREELESSIRRQKEMDEEKERRKEARRLKKESDKEIKRDLEREMSFSFRDMEGGLPIDDEFRSQRRASFDQSWSEAVSPNSNGARKKVDVGQVPKGIVAKLVNGQGKGPKSPTTLYSPRVQEELNKSIGKGLVAQRLSTAKAKEKLGGSIPSMFSSFGL